MDFEEKQKNKKIKNVAPKKINTIIYQRFTQNVNRRGHNF